MKQFETILTQMDKWISTKDRLPPRGVDCLMAVIVYDNYAITIAVGSYDSDGTPDCWRVLESYGSYCIPPDRVTHWRPLPDRLDETRGR